jgi:hypothetical protein
MDTPLRTGRDRLAADLRRRLINAVEHDNAALPDYLAGAFTAAAARVPAWLDDKQGLRGESDLRDLIQRVTRYRDLIPEMLAEHAHVPRCR